MLESLFNKVTGPKAETLSQVFSSEICEIFRNTYFEEHMQMTASKIKGANEPKQATRQK